MSPKPEFRRTRERLKTTSDESEAFFDDFGERPDAELSFAVMVLCDYLTHDELLEVWERAQAAGGGGKKLFVFWCLERIGEGAGLEVKAKVQAQVRQGSPGRLQVRLQALEDIWERLSGTSVPDAPGALSESRLSLSELEEILTAITRLCDERDARWAAWRTCARVADRFRALPSLVLLEGAWVDAVMALRERGVTEYAMLETVDLIGGGEGDVSGRSAGDPFALWCELSRATVTDMPRRRVVTPKQEATDRPQPPPRDPLVKRLPKKRPPTMNRRPAPGGGSSSPEVVIKVIPSTRLTPPA